MLPNTRFTRTDLTPVTVFLFRVNPYSNIQRHIQPPRVDLGLGWLASNILRNCFLSPRFSCFRASVFFLQFPIFVYLHFLACSSVYCGEILQTMKSVALVLATFLHLCFAYHLGFYVPMKPPKRDDAVSGRKYAHALTIAVDDVNNDPNILPGHNLTYSWTDSSDSANVLRTMYEKYIPSPTMNCGAGRAKSSNVTASPATDVAQTSSKTPVDVFIGPAFHCATAAKVAEAFKIPMISYVSTISKDLACLR